MFTAVRTSYFWFGAFPVTSVKEGKTFSETPGSKTTLSDVGVQFLKVLIGARKLFIRVSQSLASLFELQFVIKTVGLNFGNGILHVLVPGL